MKLQRFNFINLAIFFIVIGVVTGSFYYIERLSTLRYLSEGINQGLFRLEEDIQKSLQQGRLENVQALLDQASAIESSMGILSISLDGRTIAVSSSRSLGGKVIEEKYRPLSEITSALIEDGSVHYASDIYYFSGAAKQKAILLVDLNEEFIFERLNRVAMYYGMSLFLILGIIAIGIMKAVQRWIAQPLERIAKRTREENPVAEKHGIDELTMLDQTLCDSFRSMNIQKIRIKEAFEEALYLDGILRTVADINQLLITAKNVNELLMASSQRLADHTGYGLCHIALKKEENLCVEAYSTDSTGYLYPKMKILLDDQTDEKNPSMRAIKERSVVVIEHLEHNTTLGEWRFIAEEGQYGSVIALPLMSEMETLPLGVITLYSKSSEGFEPKEIAMLEELAGDIGFAINSFEQREQLKYHLSTDANTDLPNRFSLVEALSKKNISALAIINIDRFSDINEVYGITIGDAILARYGDWLRLEIQSNKNIELYKLGSDEYGLVVKNYDDLEPFVQFLEGVIAKTQKEVFVIDEIEIVLTATIGYSRADERVLEHATAALKQAKRNRHSMELFTSESKQEQENNIAWYKRIKEAIEESRILPYFQPIVDNNNGKIIKYEALIRLIERDGSVISPYLFLEIAKKTKLYPDLTKIMIDKVVSVFKDTNIPVSLNLSTQDLTNIDLADYLEQTIHENGVEKLIIFEILESEGIENYSSVSEFVDRFKAIGCRFAIDDFGSGYSNFDHLLKLNVDTLKIDASLIKNLPHDRNAQIFVKHICDFAHEMGISVVAEFVANEEIFHQVRAIGIDASQGYYFYEPSPILIEE
ncbi:MAG: GGDEF domain-containing protein [Sulfuricurvum sp.]|uniref:sensor domain-containing phosphodiesterase n=1 Tax=Sulfuricurvum sp. TaxID=2025608 RepID=UPI0025ED94CC|nr:GGDEF domain-containing protein [Sulfuricurvum sp.]MBV5320782.1 GGDEF domain-containing protein [Sulfuricurvum sp.]